MAKNKDIKRKEKSTTADPAARIGKGGELHQVAGGDVPVMTTQQGIPVADDQSTLKIGPRGPAALEDFHFREKVFHFDHERIPERVALRYWERHASVGAK